MAINIQALKQKVSKAINKLPNTVDVYRVKYNTLKEPDGEELVVRLTGQYYKSGRGSTFMFVNNGDAGSVKARQPEKFTALIDADSERVREGDRFTHTGVTYRISDLGNTLDVYFDMSLERV